MSALANVGLGAAGSNLQHLLTNSSLLVHPALAGTQAGSLVQRYWDWFFSVYRGCSERIPAAALGLSNLLLPIASRVSLITHWCWDVGLAGDVIGGSPVARGFTAADAYNTR